MWDRTQRSYHNHGILGLINPAYLLSTFQFSSWAVANPRTTMPITTICLFPELQFISERCRCPFQNSVLHSLHFFTGVHLCCWFARLIHSRSTIREAFLYKCVCVYEHMYGPGRRPAIPPPYAIPSPLPPPATTRLGWPAIYHHLARSHMLYLHAGLCHLCTT